jgi:LysM repeat protein
MKIKYVLLTLVILSLSNLTGNFLFAQQREECCDDKELEQQEEKYYRTLDSLQKRQKELKKNISSLEDQISNLNDMSADKDKNLNSLNSEYSALIKSLNLPEFDNKFNETENKINNKSALPKVIRGAYFDEISNSKAKCLPKYHDRYLAMKSKLEDWEKELSKPVVTKEEPKAGTYKVVKGDCLFKIASKKEIYGNPRLWSKIWEANKSGVVSAPKGTPSKITNPEYIYPGQVLKIPALTDTEKKISKSDKSSVKKKVRKPKPVNKKK